MGYLLDTNTFVHAHKFSYQFEVCPGYWDWLVRENENGQVFSVIRVFDELCEQNDKVSQWVKKEGSKLFLPIDLKTNVQMVQVSNHVMNLPQSYKRQSKDLFLEGGDANLLACAKAHGHVVVTGEKFIHRDPTLTKVKLPNMCEDFGVRCVTQFEMLLELGACFGLLEKQQHIPTPVNNTPGNAITDSDDSDNIDELL